jgi:citrate lyase subunit beta / citryl-CoA lyase
MLTQQNNRLLIIRSFLIFPGHIDRFFASAIKSHADAIAIDLEDSVPLEHKNIARESICSKLDSLDNTGNIFVRVNGVKSGRIEEDIKYSMHKNLTGFIVPMVESCEDIKFVDKLISRFENDNGIPNNTISLFPLIEQSLAVLNALSIAQASKRNIGLIFGHEDFLLDMHAPLITNHSNINFARSTVVAAARAINGIPIDTPYLDIKNMPGCAEHVSVGKSLGFSGMLTLHPSQVDIVNNGYTPTVKEASEAKEIVEQIQESSKEGRSVSYVNGRFVAPPILKRAQQVVHLYDETMSK